VSDEPLGLEAGCTADSAELSFGMAPVPEPPAAETILVIDDEPQIRRVVRNALAELARQILEAATASEGIDLAASAQPELIVLDLGLPDKDGLQVCQELRGFTSAPIIILSARHSEREKEKLLDAGADDYVTKPFSTVELKARARAQLRRAAQGPGPRHEGVVKTRDLAIDLVSRTVKRGADEVHLTPTEWSLLRVFVAHAGQTLTHSQLFRAVWGASAGDAQQYLRVYVGQLRRKLELDPVRPRLIRTESAVGYRFELDE
jgi:two-component system KDP operon response regulator KdpE